MSEERNIFPCPHKGQELFLALQRSPIYFIICLSDRLPLAVMVAFSNATLNVDGNCDDNKRARIFWCLRSLKYDFLLLQETHLQTEDIEAWPAEWGHLLLES